MGKMKEIAMLKIPKNSYARGNTDDGISDVLGKTDGFRYSDRFLRNWYSDNLMEITEEELIMNEVV